MPKWVFDLLKKLIPPGEGAPEREVVMWRYFLALAVFLLLLYNAVHYSYAAGIPVPGLWGTEVGFVKTARFEAFAASAATKTDLAAIDQKLEAVLAHQQKQDRANEQSRINTLRSAVIDLKKQSCRATGSFKTLLTEQLTDVLIEWRKLTGQEFPTPKCEDIPG